MSLSFKLKNETIFLAISIIDRFTTIKKVNRKNYQLLGITSLFISSKFEEIYPPKIRDFEYVCDKAYSK